MKRLSLVTIFVGCLLIVVPLVNAQDCSQFTNWDLRGTYTSSGNGWIILSKEVDPTLPPGYSPSIFVYALVFDGQGGGSGWVTTSLGGVPFNTQVKWTYAVQSDCSIQVTQSLKISGAWGKPNSMLWVIAGKSDDLKLNGIMQDAGPGSQVAFGPATRISMQY